MLFREHFFQQCGKSWEITTGQFWSIMMASKTDAGWSRDFSFAQLPLRSRLTNNKAPNPPTRVHLTKWRVIKMQMRSQLTPFAQSSRRARSMMAASAGYVRLVESGNSIVLCEGFNNIFFGHK